MVTSATVGGVVAPIVVTATLGVIGFGAAGPIAGRFLYQVTIDALRHITLRNKLGSMAAGIQSGIGNVVAGSLFAGVQSVAMGGAMAGTVATAASTLGGAVGIATAAGAAVIGLI